MASSKKDAYWILNAADLVASACDQINEGEACDVCPLRGTCLDNSSFLDVAYSFTASHWMDFLDLADDVAARADEQAYITDLIDRQREAQWED